MIQYYWQNPAALAQIDQFRLNSLRGEYRSCLVESLSGEEERLTCWIEVEKAIGVEPPETLSIDPQRPLYEACRRMLLSRARRIPLVSEDSQSDRSLVLSVVTQYRILKFMAINVSNTRLLRKPLREIRHLGTYNDLQIVDMNTLVIDVIHKMVDHNISSVPILNGDSKCEKATMQSSLILR